MGMPYTPVQFSDDLRRTELGLWKFRHQAVVFSGESRHATISMQLECFEFYLSSNAKMYLEWMLYVRYFGIYEKWYTVIDFVSSSCSSSCGIGGCGDGGGVFCCFYSSNSSSSSRGGSSNRSSSNRRGRRKGDKVEEEELDLLKKTQLDCMIFLEALVLTQCHNLHLVSHRSQFFTCR